MRRCSLCGRFSCESKLLGSEWVSDCMLGSPVDPRPALAILKEKAKMPYVAHKLRHYATLRTAVAVALDQLTRGRRYAAETLSAALDMTKFKEAEMNAALDAPWWACIVRGRPWAGHIFPEGMPTCSECGIYRATFKEEEAVNEETLEALARLVHESGREAVERHQVYRDDLPILPFCEWAELPEKAKEGRRSMARFLYLHRPAVLELLKGD